MRFSRFGGCLLAAAILTGASAQTRVDLRTQGKSIDFSGVPTKPFRMGTSLPAVCAVGETFFKTDAAAGSNFYGCTAQNVWTLQAPPELPDAAGQSGKVLTTNGSAASWSGLGGDLSGAIGAALVQALRGRAISTAAPANGNALKWNSSTSQWEPGVPSITLAGDATGAAGSTVVARLQGRTVASTAPGDGQSLKWNAASSQWEPGTPTITLSGDTAGSVGATLVQALRGRALASTAPGDGQALKWNAASSQWEPGSPAVTLSGDTTGASGSNTVAKLRGRTLATTAPSDGQALKWNAAASQWEPGSPAVTLSGDANGASGSTVVGALQGHAVASTSPVDGQSLKWNGTANRWEPGTPLITLGGDATGATATTTVRALQGRTVSSTAPSVGSVLGWNATASQWEPTTVSTTLAGDASGAMASTVVQAIQGRAVSATSPSNGQALVWSSSTSQWQPGAVTSTLAGDASGPAGATVVKALQGRTVSTAAPSDGQMLAWNNSATQWQPASLAGDASGAAGATVVRALQGRVVANTAPSSGQTLKWNSATSQWEPGGIPGNALTTFTAQTSVTVPAGTHGFTNANLLVQCYDNAGLSVEPGSVAVNPSTYDVTIAFSTPQTGSCTVNGGGGSGGAGGSGAVASVFGRTGAVAAQAGDYDFSQISGTVALAQLPAGIGGGASLDVLGVTRTSATVLTIGTGCSLSSPCNVRFGNTVTSIQAPSTVTLSAGSGDAYVYVDQSGVLTVGHNLTLACSTSCQAVSGITAFPAGTIPVASWSASSGQWAAQGADWRAWLSRTAMSAGQGIMVVDAGAAATVAVDSAVVPTYVSGSATLNFPSIPTGSCTSDMVFSVPGAAPGDTVAPGWPSTLNSGLTGTMFVGAADAVYARLCNLSGVAIDPAPAVFKATIVRSF